MSRVPVAYAILRMDQYGKDVFDAFVEIDELSEENPVTWFFDIVCMEEQNEEAKRIAQGVMTRIKTQNPEIPEQNVVVGITNDPKNLPAEKRMKMLIKFLERKSRRKK